MTHIMLDLETTGRWRGCRVLSIGAVSFDIKRGAIFSEFYQNIDCSGTSLSDDPDTISWWSKQSIEAKQHLEYNKIPLSECVDLFNSWFKSQDGEQVWGQGSNFDHPIWEGASHAVGKSVPWSFWNARDTRTAYELSELLTSEINREGVHHTALDDCKYQVKCLVESYKIINS